MMNGMNKCREVLVAILWKIKAEDIINLHLYIKRNPIISISREGMVLGRSVGDF